MLRSFLDRLETRFFLFFDGEEGGGGGGAEKTVAEKVEEIADKVGKDLLAKAKIDEQKEDDEEVEEKEEKEEKVEKKDKKDKKDDDDDEEEELSKEDLLQATQLFKVLNNPETALQGLELLVKAAGLTLGETTKKEEKEIKKTVKDVVKAKLGSKYEFLSEDLGDLLQELFDTEVKSRAGTKELEEKMVAREEKETRETVRAAFKTVSESYVNIDNKLVKEITRIQKDGEIIFGPKTDPEKYFKACFILAADNLGVTLQKKTSKQETTRTKDVSAFARLNANKGLTQKDGKGVAQVKSLDDIIKSVAADVEEKMSKK